MTRNIRLTVLLLSLLLALVLVACQAEQIPADSLNPFSCRYGIDSMITTLIENPCADESLDRIANESGVGIDFQNAKLSVDRGMLVLTTNLGAQSTMLLAPGQYGELYGEAFESNRGVFLGITHCGEFFAVQSVVSSQTRDEMMMQRALANMTKWEDVHRVLGSSVETWPRDQGKIMAHVTIVNNLTMNILEGEVEIDGISYTTKEGAFTTFLVEDAFSADDYNMGQVISPSGWKMVAGVFIQKKDFAFLIFEIQPPEASPPQ